MKLVTYDTGGSPRSAPRRRRASSTPDSTATWSPSSRPAHPSPAAAPRSPAARLLAPLRPRTLRDFLAFEGHLKNAFARPRQDDPRRVVRRTRLLQGAARHRRSGPARRSRGRRTPTSSTTSSSSPPSSAATVQGRQRADARRTTSSATRSGTTSRRATPSAASCPVGMGPGKAKDWDGSNVLGPCIVTADEFDAARRRPCASASTASCWGEDTRQHAPHLRGR